MLRATLITLDNHVAGAFNRARQSLAREIPGLELSMHAAADFHSDPDALARCREDIASAHLILVTMLFIDEQAALVMDDLRARQADCDAMVCCMSASDVMKLTRMGRFSMSGEASGPVKLLKRLRGSGGKDGKPRDAGAKQLKMLKRLPRILKYIPGTAQDLRVYFLTMQYWLAASDANVGNMFRMLLERYCGERLKAAGASLQSAPPCDYPEVGLYHPALPGRMTEDPSILPRTRDARGRVGVLLMRSYLLSGDTRHYDGVIGALEAQGLEVVPAFAAGLDARPAIDRFFVDGDGKPNVDLLLSLTGFSLIGGPAYNDSEAASAVLSRLDVPYIAAQSLEFQSLDEWRASANGLLPIESTMMVAIPELDGAIQPMVFGGRSASAETGIQRDMEVAPDRADLLARRVRNIVDLRECAVAEQRTAIVLFNFPPNSAAVGTAAHLDVFNSLLNTLRAMQAEGHQVADLPEDAATLRAMIVDGNAGDYGTDANVHTVIPTDDHVRREPWLREIEAQWGPAPGRQLSAGDGLYVLGRAFGNVFVGIQPGFGYEGDPMRLLFESGFAPTHAFSAFYRYLREDLDVHAVLHFGTHGALEFMPGKQVGLSGECWPERLIGAVPHLYLYAANNPSEGLIAKRRSGATLVSYLTPCITRAGLYKGFVDLRDTLERLRRTEVTAAEFPRLVESLCAEAEALELTVDRALWNTDPGAAATALESALNELEQTLIPFGLHVVGAGMPDVERAGMLEALAEQQQSAWTAPVGSGPTDAPAPLSAEVVAAVAAGRSAADIRAAHTLSDAQMAPLEALVNINTELNTDREIPALMRALRGRFIAPVAGGDLLRNPDILPTGRNIHGFDPFRLPSNFSVREGAMQAEALLDRHLAEGRTLPETIALVLWGTDNLKSEGAGIGQALALMGARARFDGYGRLCGAELLPLEQMSRPRIDVVMTLSGIFRDLLPMQTRLLAEAAWLAASADEPAERNYVRKHALAYQQQHDCSLEDAALRVFSNADGAYGSNVNLLIDDGAWDESDDLAEAYTRRKCFAYDCQGRPSKRPELLSTVLGSVELAYQNLDSVELGVTTVDHYFDTLGGISSAVKRESGAQIPVYISDNTTHEGRVRTIDEQVALEARTRMLNPKWYEGMLSHGAEGVKQIETHLTNTLGWSATTGRVAPWVYEELARTFVLDAEMRERLARLNPGASARVANRLIEAHERQFWNSDPEVIEDLRRAGADLEDRVEGIRETATA